MSVYCTVTGLQSGFTALHVAARYGNHRVAGVLVEYGADVNFIAKVYYFLPHYSGVAKKLGIPLKHRLAQAAKSNR